MLPINPEDRRFEDYLPGSVHEFGSIPMNEAAIIAFAVLYDPQDMHTNPDVAAAGPTGGIIASGWHTVGLMMRSFAAHYLPANGLASPGIDELRWPRPVRPGDVLRVRVTVLDARRSRSKPDRGVVNALVEMLNQRDEVVLTMRPINLVRTRRVDV